jgi:hypothetical protein
MSWSIVTTRRIGFAALAEVPLGKKIAKDKKNTDVTDVTIFQLQ